MMRFLYCFSYFRLVSVNSFFGSCLSSSTSHLLMQNSSAFFLNSESDWRRKWQPTLLLLSEKFHGWRSLVGYSSWDRKESYSTEQLLFHFSLSCAEEGNGNPLQCSCLENPGDSRAWWAAICGVAQSWIRLKRLSSSSSSSRLLDSSHSDWREVVPHCGFDLQFSCSEWCWASFHVFVSHLYVFFGEMSV